MIYRDVYRWCVCGYMMYRDGFGWCAKRIQEGVGVSMCLCFVCTGHENPPGAWANCSSTGAYMYTSKSYMWINLTSRAVYVSSADSRRGGLAGDLSEEKGRRRPVCCMSAEAWRGYVGAYGWLYVWCTCIVTIG